MPYPGGKNGAGVFQKLINLMPPHDTYVEPFLGGGAVMRLKRPAALNIGVDLDGAVVQAWLRAKRRRSSPGTAIVPEASPEIAIPAARAENGDVRSRCAGDLASLELATGSAHYSFYHRDALEFLAEGKFGPRDLVYADPPYLHSTRGRKDRYRCEMSDGQHRELLVLLRKLPCMVMVSGYWSPLYAKKLKDWNSISFEAMTRAGRTATEWVWFNFPVPVALHDYRYLGVNFRERERIKRKKARWVSRLKAMPLLEKRALLSAIAATS